MNYIQRLRVDLSFGKVSEIDHLNTLQSFFKDTTLKRTKEYFEFDYEGINILIELKTRSNNKDKYEDTMIGANKIKKAKQLIKENKELGVYFLFAFTDGLFYWKYDPLFTLKTQLGGRSDRGKPEIKSYAYIPVAELKPILI